MSTIEIQRGEGVAPARYTVAQIPGREARDLLRRLIAVAVGRNDQATAILLVDSDTGDILHRLRIDGPIVTAFNFLPDSRSLVIMGDGKAMLWRFADGRVELLPTTAFDPSLMVSDGTTLLVSGALNGQLQRIALDGAGQLGSRPVRDHRGQQA